MAALEAQYFSLRVHRSTLRLLSHTTLVAFISSHVQSLHSWRKGHLSGSKMNFAATFSSQTARTLQIILTWQLQISFLLPGALSLPGCSLPRTVLFSRRNQPISPDGERAPSCQRLVRVACRHQRKSFCCSCQVQHWIWHLLAPKQLRFPVTTTALI